MKGPLVRDFRGLAVTIYDSSWCILAALDVVMGVILEARSLVCIRGRAPAISLVFCDSSPCDI